MSTTMTALNSSSIRQAEFIRLTTASNVYTFCNAASAITVNGIAFTNLGSLLQLSDIKRDVKATSSDLSISLTGVDGTNVAVVLGSNIKGSKIEVWRGFLDSNNQIITNQVFVPSVTWNFYNTLNGFNVIGINATLNPTYVTLASLDNDPIFYTPSPLGLNGASNPIIRIKIKRISGSGWDGSVFYSTPSHGFSESYKDYMPQPTWDGEFQTIEVDMANQYIGSPDWISSVINDIRFDFGGGTDLATYQVQSIEVGTYVPTQQFFKRYQGIVSNYSITEDWNEQARTRVATVGLSCASFRTILENRVGGIRTTPKIWQAYYPADTSMNRVPAIAGSYFDFGGQPTSTGSQASSNAPSQRIFGR